MPKIPNISVYMYYGGTVAGSLSVVIDKTHWFEMRLTAAKDPDTIYLDLSKNAQKKPYSTEWEEELYCG